MRTALICRDALEAELKSASDRLRMFPRAPNGLTPDAVKATAEYRAAKERYTVAFQALRDVNESIAKNRRNATA